MSNSVGFFHEQSQIGSNMGSSDRAIMFDLPRSPLLSIAQFKHANLNNYSHGPSYIIGNSYASPQVGRYKTWARVRALTLCNPKDQWIFVVKMQSLIFWTDIPGIGRTLIKLFPWQNNWNFEYGAIRDDDAQNEHQNITVDHSFYSNRAIFDGYFLTGLEDQNTISQIPSNNITGERIRPFRNPRLIPFLRKDWIDNGN